MGAVIVFGLLGLAGVLVGVVSWRGSWTGWVDALRPAAFTGAMPGVGAGLICLALVLPTQGTGVDAVLALASMVLIVGGVVIGIWSPSWFGPRWYTERAKQSADGRYTR